MPDTGLDASATTPAQRRSNRIACQMQQQQQQREGQQDHQSVPEPEQQAERQTQSERCPKQRRRKQGRPLSSVPANAGLSAASASDFATACLTKVAVAAAMADQPVPTNQHALICFDCRYATLQLPAYADHMSRRHGLDSDEFSIYRCCQCGFLTNQTDLLTEHASLTGHCAAPTTSAVHNAAAASQASPSELPSSTEPTAQGPQRRHGHACGTCGKQFRLRYRLMRHILTVHQAADPTDTDAEPKPLAPAAVKLACRLCSKLFKSYRSYQVHRLAFHAKESAAPAATAAEPIDSCLLNGVNGAAEHCLVVSDPEPFKCRYCELKFAKKTAFARHQARDHPTERPYQCGQCGRGFKFPHSLAMHRRFHRGELTCVQCDRLFHSDREFQEHMASVHEGSLTFLCESCGRTFHTQYRLNRHARSHNQSRQLACPQCGRLFHRADKLKLHLECVHSDRRPHLCHLCGQAFNRRDKLALHIKKHQQSPGGSADARSQRRRKRWAGADLEGGGASADLQASRVVPPPKSPPTQQPPPHSPLGDALICIANGSLDDLPSDVHQQQQQQIIFLESFDQQQQQQQQQQQPLTLYSPVSGAYFAAAEGGLLQ